MTTPATLIRELGETNQLFQWIATYGKHGAHDAIYDGLPWFWPAEFLHSSLLTENRKHQFPDPAKGRLKVLHEG